MRKNNCTMMRKKGIKKYMTDVTITAQEVQSTAEE